MRGLRSHPRTCQEQTDAVQAAGPNMAGAAADGDAEVAPCYEQAASAKQDQRAARDQCLTRPAVQGWTCTKPATHGPGSAAFHRAARGSKTGEERLDCYVD